MMHLSRTFTCSYMGNWAMLKLAVVKGILGVQTLVHISENLKPCNLGFRL